APSSERARVQATLFAGVPIFDRFSAGVEAQASRRRDEGYFGRYALRGDLQIARGTSLSMSAGVAQDRASLSPDVFVSLTHFFGEQTTASAGATSQNGRSGSNVSVQRSLPMGNGFGYLVSADSTSQSGQAMVQAQSSFGQYQAEYHRTGDTNSGLLQA